MSSENGVWHSRRLLVCSDNRRVHQARAVGTMLPPHPGVDAPDLDPAQLEHVPALVLGHAHTPKHVGLALHAARQCNILAHLAARFRIELIVTIRRELREL